MHIYAATYLDGDDHPEAGSDATPQDNNGTAADEPVAPATPATDGDGNSTEPVAIAEPVPGGDNGTAAAFSRVTPNLAQKRRPAAKVVKALKAKVCGVNMCVCMMCI